MSVINSQPLIGSSGNQVTGYNLERSLRFRSSASAYLSRTPASAGNRQTFTYSTWIKRGVLGADSTILSAGNNRFVVKFSSADNSAIRIYEYNGSTFDSQLITTAVLRDPSAWYHFVLVADTTQATASNRIKVYINGSQLTSFSTANYPSQNFQLFWNSANANYISVESGNANYYDGYTAETQFVDGQALTPSSFGETDTITGVWKPKAYTGTYGTNGFYLKFNTLTSTSTLGNDSSGNSNTWTVNNVSLTTGATYDSMTDVPTLTSATAANYSVLNPLDTGSNITLSAGNLQTSQGAAAGISKGTIAVSSGKWYWEVTLSSGSTAIGIATTSSSPTQTYVGQTATSYGYYSGNGFKYNNASGTSYGATYTTNDVIGVALDLDAGTLVFYKNNTSQGTAFSSLSGTFTPAIGNDVSNTTAFNAGQRPFAYTPPSGFVALNTFNLPTSTIVAGNAHMDVVTRSGFGSSGGSITSLNFSPDFIWEKARNNAFNHQLVDSVRGLTKYLNSNTTDAETTTSNYFTALNSNGYTLGSNDYGTGVTLVDWAWRGSDSSAVSNTSGSITSTVSVNASAGFSIVTFNAGSSGNKTVGHGLGVAPKFVIVKDRTNAYTWVTYHASVVSNVNQYLELNSTNAVLTYSGIWGSTLPTSSVIGVSSGQTFNANADVVAYCWAEIAGFSKFGSYTGNGSTDGVFVYTGFRPKFVMFKRTDAAASWLMLDSSRNTYNVMTGQLYANSSIEEQTGATADFLSNGIKIRETGGGTNASGSPYIYMAFAEVPFKNSLGR